MEQAISWRTGKFVYPRGGSTPLHVMELQDYHLDRALDIAGIIAARTSRLTGNNGLMADQALMDWYGRSSTMVVAEIAKAICSDGAGLKSILDVYSGLGLQFECLKEAMASALAGCRYLAVASEEHRHAFEMLHGNDHVVDYLLNAEEEGLPDPGAAGSFDLTIVNDHDVLRRRTAPRLTLDTLLEGLRGPAIIALRVTASEDDEVRTTVRGVQVVLPSLSRILSFCRNASPFWRYRFIQGFDADVFLPEPDVAATGLLIAYDAGRDMPRPQFAVAA